MDKDLIFFWGYRKPGGILLHVCGGLDAFECPKTFGGKEEDYLPMSCEEVFELWFNSTIKLRTSIDILEMFRKEKERRVRRAKEIADFGRCK